MPVNLSQNNCELLLLLHKLYMNWHDGSVRACKLTQEGIENKPRQRNYNIKKPLQASHHQLVCNVPAMFTF